MGRLFAAHKKKAIVLISLLIVISVIALPLLSIRLAVPQIEYSNVNGYAGYQAILILDKDKSYSLALTPHRGAQAIEINGRITNAQLRDIRSALIRNRFFTLAADLSNHHVLDNSTEELHVKLGFLKVETVGYGISDPSFRAIAAELEKLVQYAQEHDNREGS